MRVATREKIDGYDFFCTHIEEKPTREFLRSLAQDLTEIDTVFSDCLFVYLYIRKNSGLNSSAKKHNFLFLVETESHNIYRRKICVTQSSK